MSGKDRNRFAQRLFTPLPGRYDRLAEILSMGQNGRWRRAMVDRIAASRQPGPWHRAGCPGAGRWSWTWRRGRPGSPLQLASRTGARVVGVDLTEEMLRQGQANVAGAGWSSRIGLVAGEAERLPFPDAQFRRADLYLPAALRRGPAGDAGRAGPGGQAGRDDGEPGVLRPAGALLAGGVGAVHPGSSCRPGGCCSAAGLAAGGPVPGAEHHRPLPPLPRPVDGRGVAAGRVHHRAGRRS